jgi:predicted enzyme related to lactoylglutathione lyase
MSTHEKMDYVEFPSKNIEKTKSFFSAVFNWKFKEYGPDYISFSDEGLNGGFYKSDLSSSMSTGGALIVFYSEDLLQTKNKIVGAGGTITKSIFSFPGGSRFHFADPNGNEYAVWSELG